MEVYKNGFFNNPSTSKCKGIRQAIKREVMAEYKLSLDQATGWQRYLIRWRINLIAEIRFRGILFMGATVTWPDHGLHSESDNARSERDGFFKKK